MAKTEPDTAKRLTLVGCKSFMNFAPRHLLAKESHHIVLFSDGYTLIFSVDLRVQRPVTVCRGLGNDAHDAKEGYTWMRD